MEVITQTPGSVAVLAYYSCTYCNGSGQCPRRTCQCVYRSIFRICMNRYKDCTHNVRMSSRKNEEYVADVYLLAKRVLTVWEFKLWLLHYHYEQDWTMCTRTLRCNRGNFFHAAYRVEDKMGQALQQLKPYALFPVEEYFK